MSFIKEYIGIGIVNDVGKMQLELQKLLGEYNKHSNRYMLVYAAALNKPQTQGVTLSLNMDDYYTICDLLRTTSEDDLDVYVETPGGRGDAAEEIVRFVHGKFKSVDFVISGEAKSAGTLMALSGDEIHMTMTGSLGPIDAQVPIGRSQVSAHDYMQWVADKQEEANKAGKLNPFDAVMVAQISPGELYGVDNALKFALDLVEEWLPKYKFKNWKKKESSGETVTAAVKKARASEIASALADHKRWRSHGRSLKIDELENIGLRINKIDDDPAKAELVYRIQTLIKLIFGGSSVYKMFVTADGHLLVNAVQAGVPTPTQKPDNATFEIECKKCGMKHKLYAKLLDNDEIDIKLTAQGFQRLPKDGKFTCSCGTLHDLSGALNAIEAQTGRKVL